MANATNNLKSRLDVWHYQFDPADASVATKSAYVRVAEHNLLSVVVRAGVLVTAKIFAATDSAGTGSALVGQVTAPTTADAKDDRRVLEVSADDVTAALAGASHICVEIDMNGSTDDSSVCLIREGLRFTTADMTADITS